MNLTVRVVLVGVMLCGAALFIFALQSDPGDAPKEPPAVQEGDAPVADAPPAKAGVLDSSANCQDCHREIYAEWKEDRHSKAWVGQLYTELSKNHTDPNCFSCHAPRPILETGLDSPAESRGEDRESGIGCLTCHRRGQHVAGRSRAFAAVAGREPDCGPVFDAQLARREAQKATAEFCGVCHNLHGTCDEFLASKYATEEGKTCLSCHMEEIVSPAVTGGPAKARLAHRFAGGHSKAMLKKALRMDARRDGELIKVRITNAGAGHKVPTDARHRGIYVRIAFFDAYGQPVRVTTNDPLTRREVTDLEVNMDVIRLFYRHEQREPTQIDPAGTLGKNNWRDSEFPIPEAAAGGRVRLRLYYHLTPVLPPQLVVADAQGDSRRGDGDQARELTVTGFLLLLLVSGDLAGAEKALAAGQAEKAIALVGDLADADDADVRALLVLGRAHLLLLDYESAVDPLLRALDKTPEDKKLARDAAWA
ncbi:MAG: multiheme c-type cytochrome, partial [Planctomycetota bacterium]